MSDAEALQTFCRMIHDRSRENSQAMALVHRGGLLGQCVGILRQELDSLVRVIYLLATADASRRAALVRTAVEGRTWTRLGSKSRVTDREMVDLADRLHGWTKSVYGFGCAFIHLSRSHDYAQTDPLARLGEAERSAILSHMRHYHGGPSSDRPSFHELGRFLPDVFRKISTNLEHYVADLEQGRSVEIASPSSPAVGTRATRSRRRVRS